MDYSGIKLLARQKLSEHTFEICLSRPRAFEFTAGQRIRLSLSGLERDYSLVNAPDDTTLRICVRQIKAGRLSSSLAALAIGSRLQISGPEGYFTFKPSNRTPLFVATGTGIAPFAAMARSGVTGFILLHGVRSSGELYYRSLLSTAAQTYVPCLSRNRSGGEGCFNGRVTAFLERHIDPGSYDIYVCGRREMIRDVTWLIDDHFPESLVYTEMFF